MRLAGRLLIASALALVGLPMAAHAQPTPGDCETGRALATLDANEVEATVFLGQNLFFSPAMWTGHRANGYVVPAEDSVSAIFAASLWLAGKVDGELRAAAARYDDFEFWPGPLEAGGALPSPTGCSAYDRIWSVTRRDVAHYLLTGEATDDLRDWPVALGAPVLDGDGIPGNYDLAAGDQPAIRGDQTAWWVMNDVGNEHGSSRTAPLGVEVRAEAFAAAEPEADDGLPAVGRATFYRYEITNRTVDVIEDAYVSLFADSDLGYGGDDYVGSDSLRHLGYVYNADNRDEVVNRYGNVIEGGYGVGPPALGFAVLEGPEGQPNGRDDDDDGTVDEDGERLGLTAFNYFFNSSITLNDPLTGTEYYNVMQGRWTNGLPMQACSIGINCGGPRTTFAFHGDPATGAGWSEVSAGTPPGDRRITASVGPFRLDPGETEVITFAILFARAGHHLHSVNALQAAADRVHTLYDAGAFAPRPVTADEFVTPPEPAPEPPSALRLSRPSPNPFPGPLALRYEVPAPTPLRLSVYDVLGREVAVLFDGVAEPGAHEATLDGAALAPGVYVVRLSVPGGSRTFAITRAPR